jgi:CspA family cold shock protein
MVVPPVPVPRGSMMFAGLRYSNLEEREMATGVVKFFDPTRGYGFIVPDDGSRDMFVHISAVQAAGLTQLFEHQRVEFDVEMDRGGWSAYRSIRQRCRPKR